MKLISLLLVLLTLRPAATFAQDTPAFLPFEPAELLKVLPSPPADWKVLRSQAGSTLGDWPETRATRSFESPAATAETPVGTPSEAAPTAPPGRIDITVVDTAGFAPPLAAFTSFTPAKSGNVEKKLLGTLPAIVTTYDNTKVFFEVLVSSRYLVQITLLNLPKHRPEDWLRNFHFDALPTTNRPVARQPNGFRLSQVDELQPRKNRSYVVSTTNAKRLDDYLKTLPEPTP